MKTNNIIIILFIIGTVALSSCGEKERVTDPAPKAKFVVSGFDVPVPCTISFINTSSNGSSYKWELGDGTISTEFNPTHTYTTRGSYFLKLVVTGPAGKDSVCKVLSLGNVQAGTSTFSYFMDRCAGVPVNFSFHSLNPQSLNYFWNFGNGTTAQVKSPIIQYAAAGNYIINFSSQINGKRDTASLGILIN